MLGEQLPAIVIGRLNFFLGALEEWNVGRIPVPVAVVPERLPLQHILLIQHLPRGMVQGHEKYAGGDHESCTHGPISSSFFAAIATIKSCAMCFTCYSCCLPPLLKNIPTA